MRWLPPRIDGVGDYTWNLACALRKQGIDVDVFTSKEQGCKGLVENEWVFPVIKLWHPKAILEALKAVTVQAPDWFCFQFVPQLYGRFCFAWQTPDILAALKKEFRCKIAVTFHEFISNWGIMPKELFLAAATHLQTKRMLSETDLPITTCARYKDTLQRLWQRHLPVTAIPVGSNIEPIFIAAQDLLSLRRKIFPEGAKIFGSLSRLSPARNFPLAIKALQAARGQGLDAWLYLIGSIEPSSPKLFKNLMRLAEKLGVKSYIVATGALSKEDLSIRLKMADVFIFPQIDGISTRNTALMAAMAHGLPILSFRPQPGNFDGFNIPCAILAERNDEQGFIRAAVECLNNSDNLSKLSAANAGYYNQHFSWPVIAESYIKAFEH